MHLGYHELRKLIDEFNEQRRQGQSARFGPPLTNAPGPGGPPPSMPSNNNLAPPPGISGPRSGFDHQQQPHTPTPHSHGSAVSVKAELPYDGDAIVPGHGDKRKREAHELSDAIRENEER